jgi:hypothetical protein
VSLVIRTSTTLTATLQTKESTRPSGMKIEAGYHTKETRHKSDIAAAAIPTHEIHPGRALVLKAAIEPAPTNDASEAKWAGPPERKIR